VKMRTMSTRLVTCAVLVCGTAVAPQPTAAPPAGATRVLEATRRGEAVSLASLFEDQDSFYYVMDHIAKGEVAWLDVAARLAPGADAHAGEELTSALALALGRSPEAVLSRSFEPITLKDICGGPGLEEDEKEYRSALDRALAAMSKVKAAALGERRDACIKFLIKEKARLAARESNK
jgi:hypothetical protein